jgi:hypothetical protein
MRESAKMSECAKASAERSSGNKNYVSRRQFIRLTFFTEDLISPRGFAYSMSNREWRTDENKRRREQKIQRRCYTRKGNTQ